MAYASFFPHIYVWSGVWQTAGWNSVIYFAALSGISPQLHEAAMIDALTTGKIATAGLDTYEHEPLPKDHPLLTLDNVVASAHAGGNTKDNDINMVNYVYHNIVAFDRGEPLNTPGDIVNGEYLKK